MCIFAKPNTNVPSSTTVSIGPAFVAPGSIVRHIWGSSDVVLFIFAGAAAEFALNKSVDWLYFTGRLPQDPIGRMFSTVQYARQIIFSSAAQAHTAINNINAIHAGVEAKRGMPIPQESYKDVLYMLIEYSIRAYELLKRKLSIAEKEEVYRVFCNMGIRMGIQQMPLTYSAWLAQRAFHLSEHLVYSKFTYDLFAQYRVHLGPFRYQVMLQVQALLLPPFVKELLGIKEHKLFFLILFAYKLANKIRVGHFCRSLLLPREYKKHITLLDVA